ncbi:MAG TPA: hypothetical protein VJ842_17180 [Pyrinomonadaceae bacterium]|nr:hypothetical protein [Pyrinomonadaceae bacterium]
MSERRDDTTEPDERAPLEERERAPQNYYYDDGTGYELYDPAQDVEDDADNKEAQN